MKEVDIPYEIYEAADDTNISATYCCGSSEVEPDKTRPEYWIIVEYPIRYQIASIEKKYDPDLLESELNARLTIGSTTVGYEARKLFEVQTSEVWASVVCTNTSHLR